jgi:predicted MFS family arabinose efflux permease
MATQSTFIDHNEPEYQTGGTRAWMILILLSLSFMFDYIDRMVIASLLPFIKQDYNVSDRMLGALTGVVSLFIALFVLPVSLLVDRWSRRKMVSLMVLFWSLATLACAFAKDYNQLLIARAFTGLGEAGYGPAAIAIIAAAFPMESRAKASGIFDAFAPIGSGIGFLVGGYIGLHYGWRHALGIVAVPGIILACIYWFTHDYKTVPLVELEDKSSTALSGLGASFKGLFKIPTLWYVYLAFAMNFAVNTPMLTWLPSYFHRFHGMDEQKAGTMAGSLALLILVGAPLGGFLADRWMRTRRNARLVLSGLTSLFSAVILLAAFLLPHTVAFAPLLVCFGILSVAFLAPGQAVIQDVVHPGMRALAYGINVVILNLLGASWSPLFLGEMSDRFGLETAFLFLPLFGALAGILFLVGSRKYERDLGRVKKVVLFEEKV